MAMLNESDWECIPDGGHEDDRVRDDERCEMHPEDDVHERLNWTDECAYCGKAMVP